MVRMVEEENDEENTLSNVETLMPTGNLRKIVLSAKFLAHGIFFCTFASPLVKFSCKIFSCEKFTFTVNFLFTPFFSGES